MSDTYDMLNYVRSRILGKTDVPDDKIYISMPTTMFVGEGPIILIYPMNGDRSTRDGDERFPNSTWLDEGISFDVLVDDVKNDVRNPKALQQACRIRKDMEMAVYMDRPTAVRDMADLEMTIQAYRPGKPLTYKLNTQNGSMVALGSELGVRYQEDWTQKSREDIIAKHSGSIQTEQSEREFHFDG